MLKQTILNADFFFEEFERQNETFLHFFEPDINIYDILSTLAIQPEFTFYTFHRLLMIVTFYQ